MTTDCDLYNSPRAVIDFRVLDLDDAKFLQSLDALRTPMSPDLSPDDVVVVQAESTTMTEENYSSELPPPLRCLSVSTRSSSTCGSSLADDGEASDSSSVSSVSLDDEFEDTQTASSKCEQAPVIKRCIFATYWEKKGGRPKQPLLSSTFEEDASPSRSEPCSEEQLLHTARSEQSSYEDLLQGNEAPVTPCSPPGNDTTTVGSCAGNAAATRRRLWDNRYVSQYQSEPVLYQAAAAADSLRKVRSTPLVGRSNTRRPAEAVTRRPSCLRQCRFSGDSRRTSSSSSSSLLSTSQQQQQQQRRSSETTVVSFSDHVQVKYLKAEPERFASPGWSKYFM